MTNDIERFLASVKEATAKVIATEIGVPHLDVVRTINRMHADGAVEREKRAGGGNEYVYWLARGAVPTPRVAAAPPAHAASALATAVANLPPAAVGAVDTSRAIVELRADVDRLTAERDAAVQRADTWRANAATLESRIDELTLGPVGARTPLFVTVGRNSKPQRHDSLDKAQRRGRSLVRSEKETEVLVLEPVGRIVRGTEWMPR